MQFLINQTRKKNYKLQVASLASISMILLLNTNAGGKAQATALHSCTEPNGRVISVGDRYLQPGSPLCLGDRINPINGNIVKVLCFLNRSFLYIKQSTVFNAQTCSSPLNEVKRCSVGNIDKCRRKFKGPNDNNEPEVISPVGSLILNPRPEISWYPVARADNYTIIVEGNGVNWEMQVKNTTIQYPKEEKELQYGNAYKITVIANIGSSPISAGTLVVNLLPETDAKQILENVQQINSLNLPPDKAAFLDLDAIYMSKSLLDESIKILKARAAAGSHNPTLYRLLGDRYLEARLLNEAEQAYTIAAQLAKSSGNVSELQKMQERLKLVLEIKADQLGNQKLSKCLTFDCQTNRHHNQLPIKTNEAQ